MNLSWTDNHLPFTMLLRHGRYHSHSTHYFDVGMIAAITTVIL